MLTFTEVKDLGTQMPNQIEARSTAGHYVYFRARHNHIDLWISLNEDDICLVEEARVYCADGMENDYWGWLEDYEFLALFKKVIKEQNIGVIAD